MPGMQSCIAYSMGKGRRNSLTNKEAKRMPGPGGYRDENFDVVKHTNPKWSMKGRGNGNKYTTDAPGPGQYQDGFKKHNSPNYTFGGKGSKTFYGGKESMPGPGQYASPSTFSKKGGYVGGRPQTHKAMVCPGPGQYSMRSTFNTRAAPFGSGKRSSPNLNRSMFVPGPGQYQPSSNFGRKTQGGGFGTGKRTGGEMKGKMPGPGQYSINDALFRDPKAASLKGRPQTTKIENRPGPGHYQSKSVHQSPAYSIGVKTKLKELTNKDYPDPGRYNPDYTKVKNKAPGVAFGTPGKDKPMGDSSMPGPGQYEVRTRVGSEGPSYGIKGRYNDPKGDMKPGPGNYNPKDEITRHGTPGTVMGSGQRDGLVRGDGAPGPGNYDLANSMNKGKQFSFGSGQRDDTSNKGRKDNPGPGQYMPPSFMGKDSQGKTIAGKIETKLLNNYPGPGTYQANERRNGPSYSLSGHRTEDPEAREKARMPPPGSYDPNDSATKTRPPGVSFGSGVKNAELKGDGIPGPGQYQLKTTLTSKGVHIAGKTPDKFRERAPGPGAYEPKGDQKYKSGPAFTMSGLSATEALPGHGMPGPGTYNSNERPNTAGFRFGSEQRQGLGGKGESPGPGQYKVDAKMGTEGKNITMAGRHELKKDVIQVGPGQYQMPTTLSGPKYSMGAGEKGTKLNRDALSNPPPGTYTIDPNAGRHKSPGNVFGKDKRDHIRNEDLPGPGNYPLGSTITNKGVTIAGRHEHNEKERAPGPGAYDQRVDPSKVHGGSIKFGHDQKSSGPKPSNAPGPGQYKVDLPYNKGTKFSQDVRDKPDKSVNPGPGQYNWRKEEGLTYF